MGFFSLKKTLIYSFVILLSLETYQLLTESTTFTSLFASIVFAGNFHEVVPNRFYRSSQMSPDKLSKIIEEYGIKTVIDLRLGEDESEKETEKAITDSFNVRYVHIPMNGSEIPLKETVLKLLHTYDSVETPILVHCSSGTHRSGFASVVWLLDKEKQHFNIASQQMSMRYGFFRAERALKAFVQGHPTIDEVLWRYKDSNLPLSFRKWVKSWKK